MMLAAMLAMVMAAAAPALAQDDEESGNQYNAAGVDCTQVLQQFGGNQYAGAVGTGDGDTAAANNQTFTADQVQQCLAIAGNNNAAAQNVGDTNVSGGGGENGGGGEEMGGGENGGGAEGGASASAGGASASAGGSEGGAAASAGGASASAGGSAAGAMLPDTGGYSLIALGAGALLVAGGLVVRRIVR
jgi:LPXTG-motif cell wall-anchored protein